jgi:DNA replication protein DnaC
MRLRERPVGRLRRAQFRTTKTLDQFDFERLPSLNRALVHDLATGRYLHEKAPVLIVGPCGTGKSHLAQALGHCAVSQGVDVIFATCAALTQSLNAARAVGSYERKLSNLARVPLLIIDDFGLKPLRSPADEDLHDLMAERYERGSTIVTSNLDFPEWDQAITGCWAAPRWTGLATTLTAWCSMALRIERPKRCQAPPNLPPNKRQNNPFV